MLHAYDLPDDVNLNIEHEATQPKNEAAQRQGAGLPLKIPSAIRPAFNNQNKNNNNNQNNNKRPRSFLAALLSPTMAPPATKQHKTTTAEDAEGQEAPHPGNALMAKWRAMTTTPTTTTTTTMTTTPAAAEKEFHRDNAENAATAFDEEVSYSDDDDADEAVPMQAEACTTAMAGVMA